MTAEAMNKLSVLLTPSVKFLIIMNVVSIVYQFKIKAAIIKISLMILSLGQI